MARCRFRSGCQFVTGQRSEVFFWGGSLGSCLVLMDCWVVEMIVRIGACPRCLCNDADAGTSWLSEWAGHLKKPQIANLKLRNDCVVLAESLHLQRYKYLWDVLFHLHPKGQWDEAKSSGMGDKKTDVPSYDLMMEMFTDQPTILILDEFQTWYEGLSNSAKQKTKNWAFNFIQILSEIAQKNPELLVLVVSVREGNSDAYQQVRRVNPVDVDFKCPYAKRHRQRLLHYRIFENHLQVPKVDIAKAIEPHVTEFSFGSAKYRRRIRKSSPKTSRSPGRSPRTCSSCSTIRC